MRFAEYANSSPIRLQESQHRVNRRLAGAVRADEGHEAPAGHPQRKIPDRVDRLQPYARAIGLGQTINRDDSVNQESDFRRLQRGEHAVVAERDATQAHAGRVEDRVGNRGQRRL